MVLRLADAAYTRVDLVEKRGECAVRGGIVDVFPPTEEHPLRVEFWGDEVEEIRAFAVADQRALEKVDRLWAPPCRKLAADRRRTPPGPGAREAHPALLELTDKIAAGIAVEGMESLAPVLVDEMIFLVDLMPVDTHVLVLDPERARARAHDLVATSEEFLGAWAAAAGGGTAPIDLGAASYRSLPDVRLHSLARDLPWWSLSPFGIDDDALDPGATDEREPLRDELGEIVSIDIDVEAGAVPTRALPARPADAYRGDLERAVGDVRGWLAEGYRVAVVHPGHGPAQRMVEAVRRARRGGAAGPPGHLDPGRRHRRLRLAHPGLRRPGQPAGAAHRRRPLGAEGLHPRHAQDAGPPQEADRPAGLTRRATTSCTSSTASAGSWR